MKLRKIIPLFLFFFSIKFFCQSIEFSNPIAVTETLNQPVIRGRVGLVTGNVPVIVWSLQVDGPNGKTYISKLNSQNEFDTPLLIDIPNQLIQLGSPDISSLSNLVFVSMFVFTNGAGTIYSAKSTDGAEGFETPVRVYPAIGGTYVQYPAINIFSDGNPSISFMHSEAGWTFPVYKVTRSLDGGLTYSAPVSATSSSNGEACSCCPATTIIQNNIQLLLWRNNINDIRTIYAAKSVNAGNSFDVSSEVDNSNWFLPACPASGPDGVLINNLLVAAWMSGANDLFRVMYGRTNVETMETELNSFVDPDVPNSVIQNHPRIAGDDDFIAIVWEDNRTNNTGIRIAVSTDGGYSFGSSVLISDEAKNVDVAYGDSTFHIIYTDIVTHQIKYLTAQINTPTSVIENEKLPASYMLYQNYPNPFNPATLIGFELPSESMVNIEIHNFLGELVQTIYSEVTSAGYHSVVWDAKKSSSGIYFYTIKAKSILDNRNYHQVRKMVLLR